MKLRLRQGQRQRRSGTIFKIRLLRPRRGHAGRKCVWVRLHLVARSDCRSCPLTPANDSDVIFTGHGPPAMERKGAMNERLSKALVLTILQHAEDFPWRVQDIGLMSLRLDDRREYRLHVWDPSNCVEEPPIHDHPYDFTSTIIAGEMTNTRYEEDPAGDEYVRFRFPPGAEGERWSDSVRLSSTATIFSGGDQYHQIAHRAPRELATAWDRDGDSVPMGEVTGAADRLRSRRGPLALGPGARRHTRGGQGLHRQSSGVVLDFSEASDQLVVCQPHGTR